MLALQNVLTNLASKTKLLCPCKGPRRSRKHEVPLGLRELAGYYGNRWGAMPVPIRKKKTQGSGISVDGIGESVPRN